jgi:YspA, cpYpsA-related SLOG family
VSTRDDGALDATQIVQRDRDEWKRRALAAEAKAKRMGAVLVEVGALPVGGKIDRGRLLRVVRAARQAAEVARPLRVIVTGGRAYGERWVDPKAPPARRTERPGWRDEVAHVRRVLGELAAEHGSLLVVQGGANGADRRAKEWADHHHGAGRGPKPVTFEADWKNLGRSAGPKRNAAMVAAGADLVVVFPGGVGMAGCAELARAAGLAVRDERAGGPKA